MTTTKRPRPLRPPHRKDTQAIDRRRLVVERAEYVTTDAYRQRQEADKQTVIEWADNAFTEGEATWAWVAQHRVAAPADPTWTWDGPRTFGDEEPWPSELPDAYWYLGARPDLGSAETCALVAHPVSGATRIISLDRVTDRIWSDDIDDTPMLVVVGLGPAIPSTTEWDQWHAACGINPDHWTYVAADDAWCVEVPSVVHGPPSIQRLPDRAAGWRCTGVAPTSPPDAWDDVLRVAVEARPSTTEGGEVRWSVWGAVDLLVDGRIIRSTGYHCLARRSTDPLADTEPIASNLADLASDRLDGVDVEAETCEALSGLVLDPERVRSRVRHL